MSFSCQTGASGKQWSTRFWRATGPFQAPSIYFMKSPPEQWTDDKARDSVEAFAAGAAN